MTSTANRSQLVAAELRRYFKVGPRTRRYRKTQDLHAAMVEMLENNAWYPGYYSPSTTEILAGTLAVASSYRKFVDGYRIDGETRLRISEMTPWQFAAMLGEMADVVTNTGEGERFFEAMRVSA